MRMKLFVATAVLMVAGVAEAGLSKAAQEWRRSPAKFLITGEESKAWKALTSDAAAAEFVDLFWARRDPTTGTPRNEFREEFLTRVRYADAAFAEKRSRGALTDRGQVYILLGPPGKGTRENMSISGPSGMSSASARSADSLIWTWPREEAIALGVPLVEVMFTQVVGTNIYGRDTKYGQFSNVAEAAIRKNVVRPELTSVPEWALRVGIETASAAPAAAAQAGGKAVGRIGRLFLLRDLGALNLDAASDPLASLTPVTSFAPDGDLAFALEYCGGTGALKVEMKVGNLVAASELEPAPMKAVAGCGVIPGMLSLSGIGRGSHELVITTIEGNGGRLTAKQQFRIE